MELTREQILELMVSILGTNIDEASWTSGGPAGDRNALLTTERVITRALNDFDTRILSALSTVDGFKARFDDVVGKNYTDDEEVFNEIGSNLIIAINDLKNTIANLTEDKIPNIGIDKVNDLQDSLDAKVDNSRVLTNVPEGALFTDTLYTHPDNHAISMVAGLQDILDDKLGAAHINDPEAHSDIRANMVIKDIGRFDNFQLAIQHAITNQLPDGIYKLVTDVAGLSMTNQDEPEDSEPMFMDLLVVIYNDTTRSIMGVTIICAFTVMRFVINPATGSILQMQDAFDSFGLGLEPETETRIMYDIQISTNGWDASEEFDGYEYYIDNSDINEGTIVDVNIRIEDLDKASSIKSANRSVIGGVILYASEIPEDDIICDMKLTIPTNYDGPVSPGM